MCEQKIIFYYKNRLCQFSRVFILLISVEKSLRVSFITPLINGETFTPAIALTVLR